MRDGYDNIYDKRLEMLARALTAVKTLDEAYRFLDDICTKAEIDEMSKRLVAAIMLRDGLTYAEVSSLTGLSTATITRVNRALKSGNCGYSTVLERIGR